MFIDVCCSGGMSSSLCCNRMAKALIATYPALRTTTEPLSTVMNKRKVSFETYDIVLVYGGINVISDASVYDISELFDVIFIAPQVAFMFPLKQDILTAGHEISTITIGNDDNDY